MAAGMGDLGAQARSEWANNPRLRLGVAVIAAVLAVYLLLVLRDWRAGLQEQYAARSEHLQKMQSLAGQDEWIARAQDARKLRQALDAQIPEVATVGLAQAGIQTWVRSLGSAFGDGLQIQSQAPQPVEGQPGLWRVPVVLSGSAEPPLVIQLVQQIEDRKSLAVIEQATVLNRANKTFSLTIVSLFRIPQAPANALE